MDQQGSFVLPAKASKVQPKQAMVPWWQTNNIKANQIISITMAKRGNTRGTPPSQTFVDSRRCTMDCLLCAMVSCSGQLDRDSWETFGSLTLFRRWFSNCVFSQLATEWIMKTDNCKNKKQAKKGKKKKQKKKTVTISFSIATSGFSTWLSSDSVLCNFFWRELYLRETDLVTLRETCDWIF